MGEPSRGVCYGNNFQFDPELFTCLGVVDELFAGWLPLAHSAANAGQCFGLGLGALQYARCLAHDFLPGVASTPLKGIIHVHNPGSRQGLRLCLRNQHDVVKVAYAGLKQSELITHQPGLGYIPGNQVEMSRILVSTTTPRKPAIAAVFAKIAVLEFAHILTL